MSSFKNASIHIRNEMILIESRTTLNCLESLSNIKQWSIFRLNELTGQNEKEIFIKNNPTFNYANLVLQPQTLYYGLYRVVLRVKILNASSSLIFKSDVETFIRIIPSGLVLSTLRQSQPMFGGTIEITRGLHQPIEFDPFFFTFDIDSIAVITSLSFKYSCRIIPQVYPQMPGTSQPIYLDIIKQNSSLKALDICFNTIGKGFLDI